MALNKNNDFENALLRLIFLNDVVGSATASYLFGNVPPPPAVPPYLTFNFGVTPPLTLTDLYISLHTGAGPGESGNQMTNECTGANYINYARKAVPRSGPPMGWNVTSYPGGPTDNQNVSNAAIIGFPTAGALSNAIVTWFGIGTAAMGTGHLLYQAQVVPSLNISQNFIPQFAIGALIVREE